MVMPLKILLQMPRLLLSVIAIEPIRYTTSVNNKSPVIRKTTPAIKSQIKLNPVFQ